MIKVKIIRNKPDIIEGDINAFFKRLRETPGIQTGYVDIKPMNSNISGMDQVMVVYNEIPVQEAPGQQTLVEPPKELFNANGDANKNNMPYRAIW